MKVFRNYLAAATVMLALAIFVSAAAAQQQEGEFEGTLTAVDTDAQVLTLRSANDQDVQLRYTDQTEVVGQDETIQGLAGKAGTKLKVNFRIEQDVPYAVRIEVLPE